jgi:hypothetical protein
MTARSPNLPSDHETYRALLLCCYLLPVFTNWRLLWGWFGPRHPSHIVTFTSIPSPSHTSNLGCDLKLMIIVAVVIII